MDKITSDGWLSTAQADPRVRLGTGLLVAPRTADSSTQLKGNRMPTRTLTFMTVLPLSRPRGPLPMPWSVLTRTWTSMARILSLINTCHIASSRRRFSPNASGRRVVVGFPSVIKGAPQSHSRTLEGTCSRRMIWMTSASKQRGRLA